MKYFENFPRTIYTFDKNTLNQQLTTNILARSIFLQGLTDNVDLAYEYIMKDTDTPESIADKVYGDPYRSWIILLFNQVINPMYDLPLRQEALAEYIKKKYNQTLQQSTTTIHHYEKVINKRTTFGGIVISEYETKSIIGEYDITFGTDKIVPNALPTTADTSIVVSTETKPYATYILTITTSHKAVSNYQYEYELNEAKRRIKILDSRYVTVVEDQFKRLMSNG